MFNLSETDFLASATDLKPQGAAGNSSAQEGTGGGLFLNVLGRAQSIAASPDTPVTDVSDQKVILLQDFSGDELPDEARSLDDTKSGFNSANIVMDSRVQSDNADSLVIVSSETDSADSVQPKLEMSAVSGLEHSDSQLFTLPATGFITELATPATPQAAGGSELATEGDDGLPEISGLAGIDRSRLASSLSVLREASNNGVFERIQAQGPGIAPPTSAKINQQMAASVFSAQRQPEAAALTTDATAEVASPIQETAFVSASVSNIQMLQQIRTAGWSVADSNKLDLSIANSDSKSESGTPGFVRTISESENLLQQTAKPITGVPTASTSHLADESIELELSSIVDNKPVVDPEQPDDFLMVRNLPQNDKIDYASLRLNSMSEAMMAQTQADKNLSSVRLSGVLTEGITDKSQAPDLARTYSPSAPTSESGTTGSSIPGMPASQISIKQAGWDRSLGANVAFMLKEEINTASIKVKPAELGAMNIQLSVQSDQLNVTIAASHAMTRETLEASLPRLREQFASLGFSQVDVNVGDSGLAGQNQQRMANNGDSSNSNRYIQSGDFQSGMDEQDMQGQIVATHNGILDTFA